ncbi:hypothetical protein CUJ91_33745 (plasmid) [Paraburkholderia graminis]|nr:hypothetical protein CUJ91_33745 [Paraburkholderia graminis]
MCRGPFNSPHIYIDSRREKKLSRSSRNGLRPPIGALLRYRTRIVLVIAEAHGQRAMTESLDTAGSTFVTTVKWKSLRELCAQLF